MYYIIFIILLTDIYQKLQNSLNLIYNKGQQQTYTKFYKLNKYKYKVVII